MKKTTKKTKDNGVSNPDGLNLSVFSRKTLKTMKNIEDIFKQAAKEQGK